MAMTKTLWTEKYYKEIELARALNRKYKGLSLLTAFEQIGFIRFIMVSSNKEKVINFVTYDNDDVRYLLPLEVLTNEHLRNYCIKEIACGAYGEIEIELMNN